MTEISIEKGQTQQDPREVSLVGLIALFDVAPLFVNSGAQEISPRLARAIYAKGCGFSGEHAWADLVRELAICHENPTRETLSQAEALAICDSLNGHAGPFRMTKDSLVLSLHSSYECDNLQEKWGLSDTFLPRLQKISDNDATAIWLMAIAYWGSPAPIFAIE
jgi:hypothetical protein